MKNIKRQLVNYRNAMVMHMWNVKNKLQDTSGEGYVDTAIKILIAVVLGALLSGRSLMHCLMIPYFLHWYAGAGNV